MKQIKHLYHKYHHAIPLLLYGLLYGIWFRYLEQTVTRDYQVIHMPLDDYIPFCELFIIPYFLWFLYIAVVIAYFFFKDKNDYYKVCIFLAVGMTVFLVISTLFPNGHHLRPALMPRDNLFTRLTAHLYSIDTPTNLWPSIHVYNSLGAHLAIAKSRHFANKKWIRRGSLILCISIILSTVFLKQHSVFDVLTAFIMAAGMYGLVYRYDIVLMLKKIKDGKHSRPQVE